jgi:hypothetical protein
MWIDYVTESGFNTVGLFLYPDSMADKLVTHREFLPWKPQKFSDILAQELESLVQFKLVGDSLSGFSQGITMHNSDTLSSLRYSRQEKIEQGDETEIIIYAIARGMMLSLSSQQSEMTDQKNSGWKCYPVFR